MTIAHQLTQLAAELRTATGAAVWLDRADVTRVGIHVTPRGYPIIATLGGVVGLGVAVTVIGADIGERYASDTLGAMLTDTIQAMMISPNIDIIANSDGSWSTATMFEPRPDLPQLPAWRILANTFYPDDND